MHDVIIQDMEKITGMTVYESPDKLWQQAIRKEDGSSNPDAIQVISPYRGEFYGTGALNTLMQNDFNPYWSRNLHFDSSLNCIIYIPPKGGNIWIGGTPGINQWLKFILC